MLFQNKLKKMIIILLVIFTTLVVGICLIKNKKKEGRVAEVPTPDESVGEEIQKEKQRMLVQDINEYNRIKKTFKNLFNI